MNSYDQPEEPDYEAIFSEFPILETERLILREIVSSDANALFELFSQEEVTRYYDLYPYETVAEAEAIIDFFADSFDSERGIRWGIARKEDNQLIGTCGYVSLRRFRGEIGYELNPNYWRHGYMSEAVQAIVNYGFNPLLLNRTEALVMTKNHASAGLLTKLGFQEEGTLRQYDYFKGAFHDMRIFSVLKQAQ